MSQAPVSGAPDEGFLRSRDTRSNDAYPELPEALPVGVYDNHTHLDFADGDTPLSVAEQLDRARAVGVVGVVQVGTDLETSRWSAEQSQLHPEILAAVAIHPNSAPRLGAAVLDHALENLATLAEQPRVRAIGETGLDFFRTDEAGRAEQLRSFEAHIDLAKRFGLALQIHDRDAHEEVVSTLKRVGAPDRTVFHCFSGDTALAKVCADAGWYVSFSGTVTFKNAPTLRAALRAMPRDRILVETDAPFLAPVPFRGRANAPYLIPVTMRVMATELDVALVELCGQIAQNTRAVYGSWD